MNTQQMKAKIQAFFDKATSEFSRVLKPDGCFVALWNPRLIEANPLLVEIERRCALPDCVARNQIGLTKPEAIEYRGFECCQCKRWNEDRATPSELPDSWTIAF